MAADRCTPRVIMKMKFLFVILLFECCFVPLFASKLNAPRALLPLFYDFSTNFTLEVTEGGCYTWSALRPHMLRLECIDNEDENGCCSRVVVSSNSKQHSRHTDTVLAEDIHSGISLRCEVILDVISSLDIVTTTREIFLDESPEAFEVRAYDDQGNEFSTLEGVSMDWHFRTEGASNRSGESTVVRYMTFAESQYETPRAIEPLERQGLKGHLVLVEGRQTGSAVVSVQLPQSEYAHIPPATVQLLVLTNLIITPQDAMILIGDSIQYRLLQFCHGKMTEIDFPSAQYNLKADDGVINVDRDTGIVTGQKLGHTKLKLVDSNVGIASDVKPPTAGVTVSTPHDLALALLPSRKWTVVVGDFYDIEAELHDASRKIFSLGTAAVINIRIDDRYFNVKYRSQNGSFIHGTPIKTGRTEVVGEFIGVRTEEGKFSKNKGPLLAAAELLIYEGIRVSPPVIVVAWDSKMRARYELPVQVTGGDGSFSWSSARSSIAIVTQRGVVKTLETGTTNITAAMTVNPSIRGTSRVHVLPPTHLEILDTPLESQVGAGIRIHVALYADVDGKRMPCTVCHLLPFQVTLSEESFEQVRDASEDNENQYPPSCAIITIIGKKPGACQVVIEYGGLSANVVIAAYNPLVPLNPASGNTVLSVGTSRVIAFTGGPRSWMMRPTEHVSTLNPQAQHHDAIALHEITTRTGSQHLYAWTVQCRALSRTTLTLEVINRVVASSSAPAFATASITVDCGRPKHLLLAPYLKNLPRCPLRAEELIALKHQELVLEVIVQDAQGNTFDNITSLEFNWKFSKPILRSLYSGPRIVTYQVEGLTFPETHLHTLTPSLLEMNDAVRTVELQARIVGYDQAILFSQNIIPESPAFPDATSRTPDIHSALTIKLVEPAVVSPNVTHLYADAGKGAVQRARILHGSGHFEVMTDSSSIVSAELVTTGTTPIIQLSSVAIGHAVIYVSDACLDTTDASLAVQVYRIGAIGLNVVEYIERGQSVQAFVNLYDESGNRLGSVSDVAHLDLTPLPASDLITVHSQEVIDGSIVFTVRGESLGLTALSVQVKDITSPSMSIQVFSEIRIQPRNLTLLVGGSVQMSITGGPSTAHVEWSISNQTAGVATDGVVTGQRIGNALLTAKAFTFNRHTGERVLSSVDSVEVRVVPLTGISIHAPITRLIAGGQMPLWAVPVGGVGDSATSRHLAATMTRFSWSVNQEDLAVLHTALNPFRVQAMDVDLVSMQLHAVKPGRVTITLTAQVNRLVAGMDADDIDGNMIEYRDSLTINILPELSVRSPRVLQFDYLLLSTHATTELRISHQARRFQVTVLQGPADLVKVTADGVVTTGAGSGSAVIAVGLAERPWHHVIVYVKPIEYIMVNAVTGWRLRAQPHEPLVHVLPNGLDVEFRVSFHDNHGNKFDAVQSSIHVDAYPKGLLGITRGQAGNNGSIILSVMNSGVSSVRVWDTQTAHQPADHLIIRSADVLFPTNARISVGDVVCIRMPISVGETSDIHGQWVVDDPQKLHLISDLGVAVACGGPRGVGAAIVSHLGMPRLRSRVEILPLDKMDFLRSDVVATTTPKVVVDYPLVLSAAEQTGKRNNLVANNNTCGESREFSPTCFPFICHLSFNNPAAPVEIQNLFQIEPAFTLSTGEYSCRIRSVGATTSQATATLTETLLLQAFSTDGSLQTPSRVLAFMPALHLHQTQLKVTYDSPQATVVLSGVQQVFNQMKVLWDKQLVTVTEIGQEETTRTFIVTVDKSWWKMEQPSSLSVIIWSPATQQKLKIPIKCFSGIIREESDSSYFFLLPWITAIVVVSVTAIVLWLASINFKKETVNTTLTSQRPGMFHSHLSPSPSNVSDLNRSLSPSSPLHRPFNNDYPIYGSPLGRQPPR